MSAFAHVDWKGWAALVTFTVQNGLAVLIIRYSKTQGAEYSSQVAVLAQELCVKLPFSMVAYAYEVGGVRTAASALVTDLRERPKDWLMLGVPALLYTIQNTLLFVGYANVEAAIGQIVYQSKILWTALFSLLLLGRQLNSVQWGSLLVLASGIVVVQLAPQLEAHPKGHHSHGDHRHSHGRGLSEQRPLVGAGALVVAALCTAFASVFFEKMLKKDPNSSLWVRNIQLSIYSAVIAVGGIFLTADENVQRQGWWHGFDAIVWLTVFWNAFGGILVAVTIKYADNILRGFAQGLSLIVGAIGSYFLFQFHISAYFVLGCSLVIGAIFLFGSKHQTPAELCEAIAMSAPAPCREQFERCGMGARELSEGLTTA